MMNKLLVIGIIAVLIIGGLYFLVPGDGGDGGVTGNTTIYVEEIGGETYSAEFDLSDPTISEQMMLSIGSGIREDVFKLQDTPGEPGGDQTTGLVNIVKTARYNVWMTAKVTIQGTDIPSKTLTSSRVKFTAVSTYQALYSSSLNANEVVISNTLRYGQSVSVDQGTVGKWCYLKNTATTSTPLLGSNLDGMQLSIYVTASAVDHNGKTVEAAQAASLTLSVSSYAADGTLTALITDIGPGHGMFSMIDADLLMNEMDMAKVEA